jgi:hypothetical protein
MMWDAVSGAFAATLAVNGISNDQIESVLYFHWKLPTDDTFTFTVTDGPSNNSSWDRYACSFGVFAELPVRVVNTTGLTLSATVDNASPAGPNGHVR